MIVSRRLPIMSPMDMNRRTRAALEFTRDIAARAANVNSAATVNLTWDGGSGLDGKPMQTLSVTSSLTAARTYTIAGEDLEGAEVGELRAWRAIQQIKSQILFDLFGYKEPRPSGGNRGGAG